MICYVVEREGIYYQGIVGVFSTKEKAEKAAKKAEDNEPDDYHDFNILKCEIDKFYKDFLEFE